MKATRPASNDILREARRLSFATTTGRWIMPQLQKAVHHDTGTTLRAGDTQFSKLIEDEQIVAWRAANRTEYSAVPAARTVCDLLELAAETVDENLPPQPKGRRDTRTVEALNGKAYTRIRTACNTIARNLRPDAKPAQYGDVLATVGASHFAWDPQAGEGGEGDWRIILDLVSRASSDKARYENVSAMRKLMDLAATHCWIPRTALDDRHEEAVPSEWAVTYESYRTTLVGSGLSVKHALLALFAACNRLGTHPDATDWNCVIEHMEDYFEASGVPSQRRSDVRRVYRALCAANVIQGPAWDGRARQRSRGLILAPTTATARIGELYGADTAQDGLKTRHEWTGFSRVTALVEGRYGMRNMITHFTCDAAAARAFGVPPRGEYPRTAIRNMGPLSKTAWRAATTVEALQNILHYAGWLARQHGTDFSADGNDLRVLLDESNLQRFYDAVLRGEITTRGRLRRIAKVLARIASPYLETIALENRNERLADAMATASSMLSSPRSTSWTSLLEESSEEAIQRERKKALAVKRAWTGDGELAEYAHDRLVVVHDELVRLLEETAGYSIEEQVVQLAGGTWRPSRQWARMVQDALYWQDQLVVPLRVATSARLDRAERSHSSDYERIFARIPALKMKTSRNGDFDPNYAVGGHGIYRTQLYALFVMRGGARDILRTDDRGTLHDVPAFYVPDLDNTQVTRLDRALFRKAVARIVRTCEPVLGEGVTLATLKQAGALGTHFFRHAFATKMVRMGMADVAALYLHQRGTDTLRRIYDANGASDFCPAALLSQADHGAVMR